MDRMRSLLQKSFTRFALCAIVVLTICTPLFYWLTKHFYAEDILELIESVKNGTGIPKGDLEADIMTGVMIQFGLIVLIFTLSLIITLRFVTKRLWMPFKDTLSKARQFDVESGSLPSFAPTSTKEFATLNRVLTRLMERDIHSYRVQKEFTENASHELQTPLAVIQGKLDLLMQDELQESQMQTIQELYLVVSRMTRLNRNLLLLSKIDNKQYVTFETIDVGRLIEENIALVGELYGKEKAHCSGTPCRLSANKPLFSIMMNNLLVNALRNIPEGGDVDISYSQERLTVSNTAIASSPLDSSRIFSRFNHSGDETSGTGIGLAMVKAICDYHGWTVQYEFSQMRHCFTVSFLR